jgi:hypothetical protein
MYVPVVKATEHQHTGKKNITDLIQVKDIYQTLSKFMTTSRRTSSKGAKIQQQTATKR